MQGGSEQHKARAAMQGGIEQCKATIVMQGERQGDSSKGR